MEEEPKEWRRLELGNDEKAWGWALDQVRMYSTLALATSGEEGPRVRPVTAVPYGGRVYVLTGSQDAKVEELDRDPRFEFYVLVKEGENTGYVRAQGEARRVEDPALRRAVGEASGFMEQYFGGPDDPKMAVLWLDIRSAEVMRPGKREYELLGR